MRRFFDLVASAVGITVLTAPLSILALLIKLEDGGTIFYSHTRVGKGFRLFKLLKFRTMVPNADCLGGPVTVGGDPRVTRLGRFLRKYKLDELPQLINVLKGDMQLVGSRPEVEKYVQLFRSDYEVLLRDRPGITDPASITYRNEEQMLEGHDVGRQYVSKVLPHKLHLSVDYARHRTFLSDLQIIIRTFFTSTGLFTRDSGSSSMGRVDVGR